MDPRTLIINLEYPYREHNSSEVPALNILLAGLGWRTEYWPSLVVAWIEQGAPIDKEMKEALDIVIEKSSSLSRCVTELLHWYAGSRRIPQAKH